MTDNYQGGPEAQLTEPSIIINEITPRSHYRYPEYCLLSGERNPVRNDAQPILVMCNVCGPHLTHKSPLLQGLCEPF
jgi:hypothetical protein